MKRKREHDPRRTGPVDVEVGQRIRLPRLRRRLSQTELANTIGVSFRQVQNYENGLNRVGAGRLTQIAEKLGVPLTTFFGSGPTEERGSEATQYSLHLLVDRRTLGYWRPSTGSPTQGSSRRSSCCGAQRSTRRLTELTTGLRSCSCGAAD